MRTLLGLTTVIGVGVAATAGVMALREHVVGDEIVLSVDTVTDPNPPEAHRADAATMEGLETALLVELGIADPYSAADERR